MPPSFQDRIKAANPLKIGPNGKTEVDKYASNQKINIKFNKQLFKMPNLVAQSKKIRTL